MTILGMTVWRRERSREPARSSSGRIGGAREFSIFAVLAFCFAVSVGFVVHRGHGQVNGVGPQPATAVHRATASNPRSDAPILATDDYAAGTAAVVDFGNVAVDTTHSAVKLVWDLALGLSNRILAYVADAWVNPVTGERVIFDAAPGAFNLTVVILAIAMVSVVMLALAGPLYASWKSRRLSRAHISRYRSY